MVIYWLQQARDSLREIYKFYKATAGKEVAGKEVAGKIRTEIYQETRYLLIFPTIGSREEGTPYRYLIKRHCKIFYSIRKERIFIELIWDTRRNPEVLQQLLNNNPNK